MQDTQLRPKVLTANLSFKGRRLEIMNNMCFACLYLFVVLSVDEIYIYIYSFLATLYSFEMVPFGGFSYSSSTISGGVVVFSLDNTSCTKMF